MSGPSVFSLEWWLTVVVLSVALNLVAAYLKPHLDRLGGHVSTRWAQRNARESAERERRIEWGSQSDTTLATLRLRAVMAGVRGITFVIFG